MCARYILDPTEYFTNRFDLPFVSIIPDANFNAGPGENLPVIIKDQNANELKNMNWGMKIIIRNPKTKLVQNKNLINLRLENVLSKMIYKGFYKKTRCIIPTSGFYEWDSKHRPYAFFPVDKKLINFAGIFQTSRDNETKEEYLTFSILTKEATDEFREIHDRMPVILNKELEQLWLDSSVDTNLIEDSLKTINQTRWKMYLVSSDINKPQNKGMNVMNPVGEISN